MKCEILPSTITDRRGNEWAQSEGRSRNQSDITQVTIQKHDTDLKFACFNDNIPFLGAFAGSSCLKTRGRFETWGLGGFGTSNSVGVASLFSLVLFGWYWDFSKCSEQTLMLTCRYSAELFMRSSLLMFTTHFFALEKKANMKYRTKWQYILFGHQMQGTMKSQNIIIVLFSSWHMVSHMFSQLPRANTVNVYIVCLYISLTSFHLTWPFQQSESYKSNHTFKHCKTKLKLNKWRHMQTVKMTRLEYQSRTPLRIFLSLLLNCPIDKLCKAASRSEFQEVTAWYYCFQNKVDTGHSGELPWILTFSPMPAQLTQADQPGAASQLGSAGPAVGRVWVFTEALKNNPWQPYFGSSSTKVRWVCCLFVYWGFRARRLPRSFCAHAKVRWVAARVTIGRSSWSDPLLFAANCNGLQLLAATVLMVRCGK